MGQHLVQVQRPGPGIGHRDRAHGHQPAASRALALGPVLWAKQSHFNFKITAGRSYIISDMYLVSDYSNPNRGVLLRSYCAYCACAAALAPALMLPHASAVATTSATTAHAQHVPAKATSAIWYFLVDTPTPTLCSL
eukprot:scaffold22615_cov133-Isochrysis_galbana.AAC.2